MAQQTQQSQANILQQMRGAAGGSGIAALAQTLANQGALESQKAAASIGAQEAANRQLRAQEASRLQGLEREGELVSRQAEADKVGTLLGMAASDAAAQRDAQQQFRNQAIQGLGSAIQGGIGLASEMQSAGSSIDTTSTDTTSTVSDVTQSFVDENIASGNIDPSIDTPEKFKQFIQNIKLP